MEKHKDCPVSWEVSLTGSDSVKPAALLCQEFNIRHLNITHRHNGLQEIHRALQLHTCLPKSTVIPHLSTRRLPTLSQHNTQELQDWITLASKLHPPHILIISGSPHTEFDTLAVIKQLADQPIPLAVAYNPYGHSPADEDRLHAKLLNPNVNTVYLQIGENPYHVFAANKLIRSIRPEIAIQGCLLLPTAFIRQHLQNTHWHGVTLSHDYLHYPIHAWEVTHIMYATYQRLGIGILIEALPFNKQTYDEYMRFLGEPFSPQ